MSIMNHHVTTSPDFRIRSPLTSAEIETFFRLNAQVFRPDEDTNLVAAYRHRFITEEPDFRPSQLRGAFLGETYVGGYILLERWLCLGSARIRTGCISGVVTHPDYRHQGIATALMLDAIGYAHSQQYALLFLHGLPNFYYQFGYSDVLEDMPRHNIDRKHIPEQSSETYEVRSATLEDAQALLALYQRHYSPYLGSFAPTRTIQRQEHLIHNWFEVTDVKSLLALDANNALQGYLLLTRRWNKLFAYEVAADTWPATLALLRYHSQLLDTEVDPPQELWWPLPPTDLTYYYLADRFPVRSEMFSYPDRGWMARITHLPTLLRSLLPLWRDRIQQSTLDWSGMLALGIDDQTSFLEIGSMGIHLTEHVSTSTHSVKLSQQIFTQLIFGFRPISWAIIQPGQQIPNELIPLLDILFPLSQAWVAGSDFF